MIKGWKYQLSSVRVREMNCRLVKGSLTLRYGNSIDSKCVTWSFCFDTPDMVNQVFDVTSYVEEHPGGDAILAHARDDSIEGFSGSSEVICKQPSTIGLQN